MRTNERNAAPRMLKTAGAEAAGLVVKTTAQIGRCGEILVQYKLLKAGIESASMTTDRGIDIVAYSSTKRRAVTIQVKTNLQSKPAGGRGKPALDWWIPINNPAQTVALVNLATDDVWIFTRQELAKLAFQQSNERLHLYFYTGNDAVPRKHGLFAADYHKFKLENRLTKIFGRAESSS